ncbi:hypothetical protein BOTBODRAFT_180549 [Botryobasidium botryosum FD-172 SS1]|uniref:Uncharacterized protein n=1 Tax=Botryobasidium botryosum (strain FD-172 SS1) TaxID=930990 RepID=A0A067LWK2_BOTB1|nr:hypothetical protein BOTBODRAFT_180549 [Botryobasidium botryosum FD-172 SS1]
MGLFYAYAKDVCQGSMCCYTIVFASCSVADEWWRAVSNSSTRYARSIQRITPHFYDYNSSIADIARTILEVDVATTFRGKIIFSGVGVETLSIIPLQDYVEPVSGHWFYIRSKASPRECWFMTPDGQVRASPHDASRFCISLKDAASVKGETKVMIATDDIGIVSSAFSNPIAKTSEGFLHDGVHGRAGGILKFGDFNGGFERRTKGICAVAGTGERWELLSDL